MDTALHLEATHPKKYKGMGAALADLVRELHRRWPGACLCQNRGFAVLDRTAPDIDFLLLEGLTSTQDHDSGAYVRVAEADREWLSAQAEAARQRNPRLVTLSLDYAAPDDAGLAREAIAYARGRGFVPYVANYTLDAVYAHTLDR